MENSKTGKVKFFNEQKGFGFILDDENGKDVFVHTSGLSENTTIQEGDEVTFDTEQGQKGINAINVSLK